MSKVSFIIEYAGLQLQIAKNEQGEDVTPLKPISDLFSLQWPRQYKKVTESELLSKYLGVCTVHMYHAGGQNREQTCILLSRVAAFLMSISPDSVRASGNETGADFLIEKLNEWADALHDYETFGVAIKGQKNTEAQLELARINTAIRLLAAKSRTKSTNDRKASKSHTNSPRSKSHNFPVFFTSHPRGGFFSSIPTKFVHFTSKRALVTPPRPRALWVCIYAAARILDSLDGLGGNGGIDANKKCADLCASYMQ